MLRKSGFQFVGMKPGHAQRANATGRTGILPVEAAERRARSVFFFFFSSLLPRTLRALCKP